MDELLENGTILFSECGKKYRVKKILGAGSKGEVYDVENNGKHYALKWYYKRNATSMQKLILKKLMAQGKPDRCFLWPEDLVYQQNSEAFGYIMELHPSEYRGIIDLIKRRSEVTFFVICKAAFYMTKGYRKLHEMGYCYREVSFGNVFFDPKTGEVLICDNDNIALNEKDGYLEYGTPRFMAPEIILGKAQPSCTTDLFSLAVLLFYMFMLNHPLEGRMEKEINCMDIPAVSKLYGASPVFIFDPDNEDNRPVKGYQDNALFYWNLCPESLKTLFTQAFTVGIHSPSQRVTENKWLEMLSNLLSGIMICPKCGSEIFYNERKEQRKENHICWNCQSAISVPAKIVIDECKILLSENAKLFANHLYHNDDIDSVVGEVVQHPKNPDLWGICNRDKKNWIYEKVDGTQIMVAPGRSAAIVSGAKLHFGQCTGIFI